jgi:predicted DNA-binding transcriptional regulator AlpA
MNIVGDPYAYPPRGLTREDAARYIGLGPTKLDELVEQGKMPKPTRIGRKLVFDRLKLDAAFGDLQSEDDNPLDHVGRILGLGEE